MDIMYFQHLFLGGDPEGLAFSNSHSSDQVEFRAGRAVCHRVKIRVKFTRSPPARSTDDSRLGPANNIQEALVCTHRYRCNRYCTELQPAFAAGHLCDSWHQLCGARGKSFGDVIDLSVHDTYLAPFPRVISLGIIQDASPSQYWATCEFLVYRSLSTLNNEPISDDWVQAWTTFELRV